MNTEIKQKWLDALRSGDYKQTTGALKTTKGFCCMGVLCDIIKTELDAEWEQPSGITDGFIDLHCFNFLGNSQFLPSEILEYVGLHYQECSIAIHDANSKVYTNLAELNDNGTSFSDIADLIEYNF